MHHDLHEFIELLRLSRWQRLFHRRTRRHVLGVSLGTGLMLTGSSMALYPWDILPHALWDALAYGIHGVGFVPLAKHVEPLWDILITKGGPS